MRDPSPVFRSALQRAGRAATVGRVAMLAVTLAEGIAFAADGARTRSGPQPQRPMGVWRKTGPLVDARAWPTATILADGRVLLVGGKRGEAPSVASSAELWDPRSETST